MLEEYDGYKHLAYKINGYESLQVSKARLYLNDAELDEGKEFYEIIEKDLNRVLA